MLTRWKKIYNMVELNLKLKKKIRIKFMVVIILLILKMLKGNMLRLILRIKMLKWKHLIKELNNKFISRYLFF